MGGGVHKPNIMMFYYCSFLLLAQKKETKEKGSLKSFLGLTFYRLPTH
jgi:hypothetical protein